MNLRRFPIIWRGTSPILWTGFSAAVHLYLGRRRLKQIHCKGSSMKLFWFLSFCFYFYFKLWCISQLKLESGDFFRPPHEVESQMVQRLQGANWDVACGHCTAGRSGAQMVRPWPPRDEAKEKATTLRLHLQKPRRQKKVPDVIKVGKKNITLIFTENKWHVCLLSCDKTLNGWSSSVEEEETGKDEDIQRGSDAACRCVSGSATLPSGGGLVSWHQFQHDFPPLIWSEDSQLKPCRRKMSNTMQLIWWFFINCSKYDHKYVIRRFILILFDHPMSTRYLSTSRFKHKG